MEKYDHGTPRLCELQQHHTKNLDCDSLCRLQFGRDDLFDLDDRRRERRDTFRQLLRRHGAFVNAPPERPAAANDDGTEETAGKKVS